MQEELMARKVFSKIGLSLAVFLLVTTIFQVGVSFLIRLEILQLGDHEVDKAMMMSMGIMYLIGFPVFLLMSRRIPAAKKIPVRTWSFSQLSSTFIICLSLVYIGNIIGQLLMFMVSMLTGNPMVNGVNVMINNMNIWLVLILTVGIAPVVEEIIFRKVLIDRIISYGEGVAVVVSGVLFGLVHGNFYQFFYACALGMIFAYMYVKTGKLSYPIVFHMIINFIGGALPVALMNLVKINFVAGTLLLCTFGFWIIGCIIVGIVLLICFRKSITLEAGAISIPKGTKFQVIFLNTGMILYVLSCAGMFFIS